LNEYKTMQKDLQNEIIVINKKYENEILLLNDRLEKEKSKVYICTSIYMCVHI
jgi:hypothetical protein